MGVLNAFFAWGWGIRPSKKLPVGGWSGLELTDTSTWGEEEGTSGQYMNIHVDGNVLVLEIKHYQGILMQITKIK